MSRVENYLVEIVDKKSGNALGNGGVVLDSAGNAKLVTATHVAFQGFDQRDIVACWRNGRKEHVDFIREKESEISTAILPDIDGLIPAKNITTNETLIIKGSLNRREHNIMVMPIFIGGKKVIGSDLGLPLTGSIIHCKGVTEYDIVFHGVSGSLLLQKEQVVGIITAYYTKNQRLSLGWMLNKL